MSSAKAEDLPGVLGHELRNPLASAVTNISLLREMIDENDSRGAMAERALNDLDRIARLIDGWLRLSRGAKPRLGPVEIDDLLQCVAQRHRATVVSNRIGVVVEGDRALLERAIDNLLENSVQAGAQNLRLAAHWLDHEVTIHVEDDGAGIRAQDVGKVFKPGWSGRGSNGLGLHAVLATVRSHGGSIQCVCLKRGTRFSLRLPMSRLQPAFA